MPKMTNTLSDNSAPFRNALASLMRVVDANACGRMPDEVNEAILDARYGLRGLDRHQSAWDRVRKNFSEDDHRAQLENLVGSIRGQWGNDLPQAVRDAMDKAENFLWNQEPGPEKADFQP